MYGFLSECGKTLVAIFPIDTTGAASAGLWASFANWKKCLITIAIGNQTTLTPQAVTITQATDNAAAGEKAVGFDWKITGVHNQTTDAMVRAAVTSNTFNTEAVDNKVYQIELVDTMLDIANGFKYFRVNIATPGANACPIVCIYQFYHADWNASPGTQPSLVT